MYLLYYYIQSTNNIYKIYYIRPNFLWAKLAGSCEKSQPAFPLYTQVRCVFRPEWSWLLSIQWQLSYLFQYVIQNNLSYFKNEWHMLPDAYTKLFHSFCSLILLQTAQQIHHMEEMRKRNLKLGVKVISWRWRSEMLNGNQERYFHIHF